MKLITVTERRIMTNYIDIVCIFQFNLPTVLANDSDSMTKIPDILQANGYGCTGTTPNFIITKTVTLQYNISMTLNQIGTALITRYNAELAIINSYTLNNNDKMLDASWDGTTWTFAKVGI
jgi:hypothetical protein